ncbi:MAG: CoA-acylating methylmalonate-semialdehyde dehydrogenase [Deltaproteobacteria bacterium]|nr:CoA-acylating methylmalonate-semialdehyde dehydrogenase [Deltaproteobacteria bacterium]MCB9787100.1 CoA-acylating methylmalonate-semialdehyde dehydrogenase [Deltaproteobacteria bacterium]
MTSAPHSTPFSATSYDFTPYRDCLNFIGGEWVPSHTGRTMPVTNPRHGKVMGTVPVSDAEDVARAVAAASAAFPAWRAVPLKERVQILYRLKALMERQLDEMSWLLSHENGKIFSEAQGSVLKGIECLEFGISLPNMAAGQQLDVSRGINCQVTYEPLGVCAGISPFNFPVMVPLWMLPQALVAGNTFVLKPSEQVPFGAMRIAQLLREAGLPDGVLNVVNGTRESVEAICDSPEIRAIGFVGSTKVARIVYERGSAHGKRVLALGGAKNHLVVVPDADPELTAQTLAASAFGCAGQRCMAASVTVAVGDVDHIIEGMVEAGRNVKLGEDMGAIINPEAAERIRGYIDDAERRGAKVLLDGRKAQVDGAPGNWVGPTILDGVTPDMPAWTDEIFGPVMSIVHVKTVDEAIALENSCPYGNAASIFTTNGGVARYAIERFQAGMCGVNIGVPVPREPFAFGGWNDSRFGAGDMTGYDGYRFWTQPRKVTTRWAAQHDQTWMS